MIKSLIKNTIKSLLDWSHKTRVGRMCTDHVIHRVINSSATIDHNGTRMTFATPNRINRYRAETFSTKEVETLEWIDQFEQGSIVWDIGANVGLYSCYAAKARGCQVYAFEPSIFNLEWLARNSFLNDCTDRVTIVALPLSSSKSTSTFNMGTTEWGGALSTFGESYTFDGTPLETKFSYSTLGVSMNDAHTDLQIPMPNKIKIDVDGIEHLILAGGETVLQHCDSLLIEINDDFAEQRDSCEEILSKAGLRLKEKRRSDVVQNPAFDHTFNQIWTREKP